MTVSPAADNASGSFPIHQLSTQKSNRTHTTYIQNNILLITLHYITYLVSTYRIGLEQWTLQCHTMDAGEFGFTR